MKEGTKVVVRLSKIVLIRYNHGGGANLYVEGYEDNPVSVKETVEEVLIAMEEEW